MFPKRVPKTCHKTNCALLGSMILAASGAVAETPQLDEIVVTASKRAAAVSVQDLSISVTAVDEAKIEQTFSSDLTDIGYLVPNSQLQPASTFPGFANFTIRGIGVNNSVRTVDPAVNIIQDGMVVGFQVGTIFDTFDLEAVEVLRGPQGVLFGRNSTGGAVSLRTRRPDGEFGVRGKVTIGDYNRLDTALSVEGALSDNVAAKLAVINRSQDGFFEDNNGGTFVVAPNNPSGLQPANVSRDQAEVDTLVIKPTVVFAPTDNLEITLLGQYMESNGGGGVAQAFAPPGGAAVTPLFGFTPPSDKFEINHDLPGSSDIEAYHLIGEVQYELEHGVVTSVTGYRDVEYTTNLDLDGTPFPLVHFPNNEEEGDQFSQEIRYASTFSDQYEFVAGLYYFSQEYSVTERRQVSRLAVGAPTHLPLVNIQGDFTHEQESYAVFGNFNYFLTDQVTLSVGGRYTWEDKEIDVIPLGGCAGPGFAGCPSTSTKLDESWQNFSPRVGIEYQPHEDQLWYVTYSTGFRSGNFNGRASSVPAVGPADEEEVRSLEFGVKSEFLDNRVRLNMALFYSRFDDIQRTINTQVNNNSVQTLSNAADADIMGAEVELTALATENLTLEMNLGWTDTEYGSFTGLDFDGDNIVTSAEEKRAEGLDFDRVPEFTAYLAATYGFDIPQLEGDLAARVSWAWRDDFFIDVRNSPNQLQEDYGLLDASLTYTGNNFTISLFGRNLTEEEYVDLFTEFFAQQGHGGTPRTWGVEISMAL